MELRRSNAQKLIRSGCTIVPSTDNYLGSAPEFRREPKLENQEDGIGTIIAIEGLSGPEGYPALVAALNERGWSDEDVDAVTSGNLLRFLRASL